MRKDTNTYSEATRLIKSPDENGVIDTYHSSAFPLYMTATFSEQNVATPGEYDYTRAGNPTRTNLENHIASAANVKHCYALASGMSCIDLILRLCPQNKETVANIDLYGGTDRLMRLYEKNVGQSAKFTDFTSPQQYESVVSENTGLVLIESISNPLLQVYDVKKVISYIKSQNPDCVVALDNTALTFLNFNPLDYGADVFFDSATKYLSGHGDIMAGVIYTNDERINQEIRYAIRAVGCALSPMDSWLLMRGIKTLKLRLRAQEESALKIAKHLATKKYLSVHYPGLEKSLLQTYSKGPGSVLNIITGDLDMSTRFVNALKIFRVSVSFGSISSNVTLPLMQSHASIPKEVLKARSFPFDVVRISVGIEDVDDLIADIDQALDSARSYAKKN